MKNKLFLILSAVTVLSLSSCGKKPSDKGNDQTIVDDGGGSGDSQKEIYTITFNSNNGSLVENQSVEKGNKIVKPTDPTKLGYEFVNWTYQGQEWSFESGVVNQDMTLVANWMVITYNISYTLNDGTNHETNPTTYNVEESKVLYEPTKTGYSFAGWTLNGESISTIQAGTYGDITLVANWTINSYNVIVISSDTIKGTVSGSGSYEYNSLVTVSATHNNGYEFDGWYSGTSLMSSNPSYEFSMPNYNVSLIAEWSIITYNITYDLNDGDNSLSNPSTYNVEDTINLVNPSKTGYSFAGWTLDGNLITEISAGTYGDITLVANWTINSYNVSVTSSDETKGTVSGSGSYEYNSVVMVEAVPATDCVFKGWFSDSMLTTKVSEDALYTFAMPDSSVSLYAKFLTEVEAQAEIDLFKAQGIIPVIDEDNKTITYGLYPQTNVDDEDLITELESLTTTESNGWYLHNYIYYAKLSATPYSTNYKFDNGSYIVNNTTYWFKCEPITWKILSNNQGIYYLLSTVLIEPHRFSGSSNNYANSEIRTWLNQDFYNSAFALHSSYVKLTIFNNGASTTISTPNVYACSNTEDYVFLASYQDYCNNSYGFDNTDQESLTRFCPVTDYARAKGSYTYQNPLYMNNGYYWTRSPDVESSFSVSNLHIDGSIKKKIMTMTNVSARPAITFSVS